LVARRVLRISLHQECRSIINGSSRAQILSTEHRWQKSCLLLYFILLARAGNTSVVRYPCVSVECNFGASTCLHCSMSPCPSPPLALPEACPKFIVVIFTLEPPGPETRIHRHGHLGHHVPRYRAVNEWMCLFSSVFFAFVLQFICIHSMYEHNCMLNIVLSLCHLWSESL
jgi:hypothetical protein